MVRRVFPGIVAAGIAGLLALEASGATVLLQDTIPNPTADANDAFGFAVAATGGWVVIGTPFDDTTATDAGAAFVVSSGTIQMLANPSAGIDVNFFGATVAVAGGQVFVGAPSDDTAANNAGAVYVFDAATGALLPLTLADPSADMADQFGYTVAAADGLVVVGATGDDTGASNAGAAYLFDATTGALLHTLANPDPSVGDIFGISVAVADGLVVVGSGDQSGAKDGSAYVFDASSGALLQTLVNPDPDPNGSDFFGYSLAIAGGLVIGGAPSDDTFGVSAGAAYVFDASTGALLYSLANPDPDPMSGGRFGFSVAAAGSLLVVGAHAEDTGAGNAYVFSASTGELARTISNPAPTTGDAFGYAVAALASEVIVGAPSDSAGAVAAGTTYVFTVSNAAPVASDDTASTSESSDATIEIVTLLANDTDPDGDSLTLIEVSAGPEGSVAISGTNLVYTPSSSFVGTDVFTYTVRDPSSATSTASVTVTVSRDDKKGNGCGCDLGAHAAGSSPGGVVVATSVLLLAVALRSRRFR